MITIKYDKEWDDYSHNYDLITDLGKFIATALSLGKKIKIEEV